MPKVILDAGHGGSDVGEYYERRSEKNDNLLLALRVGQFLEDRGIDVAYTRTADVYLPMKERVAIVNQAGADLLVSIHRHSGNSLYSTPGLDFFVKENDEYGVKVADNIGQSLSDSGYERYVTIVRTDIPLLSETCMSAIMAGIGYVRSDEDILNCDNNFVEIAEEIAEGIYKSLMNTEGEVCNSNFHSKQYGYQVRIGPYLDYNQVFDSQFKLCSLGLETKILKSTDLYFICTPDYEELDEAALVELKLRRSGYRSFIIRT